ncbi:hypothetical protein GVY41_18260 [Frigidibacter albus]|uniref:UGSC-like domain-containing protein n=1 Tax=Frigidibacter albus TaxID=1465486 RepID=A0A6L8VMP3_9RHOB|nr:hypothetical protein [Frigidibacter albus]MZQ91061.1 hypothetical protein [Frigidibacter albus]NBE32946.1 hypothetical protein [Frigidibacter albus]GGH62575.1 hypothetical protein GCM10011341_36890 [Frigidibacter albus]
MLTILAPRAEPGVPVEAYTRSADTGRAGLRVALLSNGFPDATNLLRAVGKALETRPNGAQITLFERKDPWSWPRPRWCGRS